MSQKLQSDSIELDDFDKCVVRRTVNEMYGIKRIQFLLGSIKIQLLVDIKYHSHEVAKRAWVFIEYMFSREKNFLRKEFYCEYFPI